MKIAKVIISFCLSISLLCKLDSFTEVFLQVEFPLKTGSLERMDIASLVLATQKFTATC